MLGDRLVPGTETEEDELVRVDEEVLVEIRRACVVILLRPSVGVQHPVDHSLVDPLVEASVVAVDDGVELGRLEIGQVFIGVSCCRCLGGQVVFRLFLIHF